MKYKYPVLIGVAILLLIAGLVICLTNKDDRSKEKEVDLKFEELVMFCQENQKEIEAVSDEILSIIDTDMSLNDVDSVAEQITNPEWARISETLKVNYPVNEENTGNILYYFYESFEKGRYVLKVLYIDADKESAESYISNRFNPVDRIQKINEHLYVCLIEQMMT